jgi:hypothetical protein
MWEPRRPVAVIALSFFMGRIFGPERKEMTVRWGEGEAFGSEEPKPLLVQIYLKLKRKGRAYGGRWCLVGTEA